MTVEQILLILSLVSGMSPQLLYSEPKKSDISKFMVKSMYVDDSESLLLTPYLDDGDIRRAQKLARDHKPPFNDDILSYSGLLTVDKRFDSNLFFWFFSAQNNQERAHVILWLQRGPGWSSLFGLFTELGPYRVNEDYATVSMIQYSWSGNYSVLFIDNPVGTANMWAFIVVGLCLSWGVAPQMIRMSKEEIDRAKSNVHLGKSVFERPSPGGLILTPYVESGKIKKAQNFSRVRGGPFHDNIESYSGYFTVEKEYNSNLFFWFFPAENDYENAPVILWLQGGPGGSSMFGLFTELGPYRVEKDDATVTKAPYSWTENYSILYIDNPVETGFSFTENENGYSRNQSHVGANLYSALIQFFTLFPELQKNEFYVAGESYGGKYIPTIGYTIYKRNPSASLKINLKGLFIGNGLSDPVNMLHYSDFVYQIGLLDTDARDEVKYVEEYARKLITRGDYEKAAYAWFAALQHVCKMSGFNNLYNFLYHEEPKVGGNFSKFLNREDVKEALHVGENKEFYKSNRDVYMMMLSDLMASVRPWVEELLDNGIRVVYYSGQLDIIVAYAISVPYYNALKFNSADEYKTAVRLAWHVDGELAGYFKSAGNFTEVLVRNAGHMVPSDQPKWALDLLERFISNTL